MTPLSFSTISSPERAKAFGYRFFGFRYAG